MKILMVYPEFPDTFWSFKHALKFVRKKAGAPPLGLLTVAAMLPFAWEKRLVDLNVTNLSDKDLDWADYVFVSAMVVQRDSARLVIDRCRERGVKIVAGGPLFTMEHENFPGVDHFVLNEAEATLAPFLRDLEENRLERVYASTEFPDIHQTPVPLWSLANLKHYDTISIQFSRGCPYDCDFCNITTLLGHRPRTKTAAQIIAELDSLYAMGWRKSIFFVDDNFIGNKKHIKSEVLPRLIEWRKGKTGMPFSTEASINLADDPVLVQLMVDAGFDTVFVGIETPNPEGLAECNKNQNQGRDLVESVKRLQRAGLQVQGGFIVGFDSDPVSIFQQQIEFIQKSGIVTAMVGLLRPLGPACTAHVSGRAAWSGILGRQRGWLHQYRSQDGTGSLREGYRILRQSTPRFYYSAYTFLREYQPPGSDAGSRTCWRWRSIYQLGIRGAERVHYWKLFFWTLFRRPRLFPLAITLAIYGYHFRQVAALHVI
jgi:radical SAM superfamily enzyme YgiQ (UPF0313 family)